MQRPSARDQPQDRASLVRYLVLAWLCGAAAIAYVQRNSIGVAAAAIRQDLGLDDDQMGWVMGAFFVSYAIFQIPSGWLGDRWQTRHALALFALTWSLATGMSGLAMGMAGLFAVRFLMGAAQAGVFPCCTNSVGHWFPNVERALASGALGSFMSLGGGIGAMLTGELLAPLGWRWLFVCYAVPGLLWAVGFYVWFRNQPEEHSWVDDQERRIIASGRADPPANAAESGSTPWLAICTSPAMGWICGQQFFRAAGYTFYSTWMPLFLLEVHEVSTKQSGYMTSLPVWAVVPAGLLGGFISDQLLVRTGSRWLSRVGVAAVSLAASALCFLAAYFVGNAWAVVLLISAGSFLAAGAGPAGYTITIDMGGRHVGTVFSTMNMAGNIGAVIFSIIVPRFVRWTGSWSSILLLMFGIYLAGTVCWLLLNPRGTVFDHSWLGKNGPGST